MKAMAQLRYACRIRTAAIAARRIAMLGFARALPLALSLPLSAFAAGAPPAAADDVGVFARYAGTWKVELHHVETPYSKASNETMTVKNDCWRSEIFYVCDQIIDG